MAEVFDISSSMFNAVYIADILTFTFTLFTLTMLPSIPFFRKHYPTLYPLASPTLIAYSFIIFIGILLFSLVLGKIFKFSIEEISISANAALGGPTTAAACAGAKGWFDLVTPGLVTRWVTDNIKKPLYN